MHGKIFVKCATDFNKQFINLPHLKMFHYWVILPVFVIYVITNAQVKQTFHPEEKTLAS